MKGLNASVWIVMVAFLVASLVFPTPFAEAQGSTLQRQPYFLCWATSNNPQVTILTPAEGAEFDQGDVIHISAKVVSCVPVLSVVANITLPGFAWELPMTRTEGNIFTGIYNTSFDSTDLPGNYNIKVTATAIFNMKSHDEVDITVLDITPPVLTPVIPQEGETLIIMTDAPEVEVDFTLQADEDLLWASYSINGDTFPLEQVDGSSNWTAMDGYRASLQRGEHTITFSGEDMWGNPAVDVVVDFTIFLETECNGGNEGNDCNAKLSGDYDKVILTESITNCQGTCIVFNADNVIFDGGKNQGYYIQGDNVGNDRGIDLNEHSGVTVQNAEVKEFRHGIFSAGGNNNILNNYVHHHGQIGITWYGNNYRVEGNVVEWNNADGISAGPTSNNEIINNIVRLNQWNGMGLFQISNSVIKDNKLEFNGIGPMHAGIHLFSSNGNTIFHNNIMSNYVQVINDGSNNWDNELPDGGNYWDDFDTSEEGCNDDNGDGICDSPYPYGIPDQYPWTTESGWI